jgi:agmatinase
VAPHYDPTGITCFLAAQLLMNFLGFIFHERFERGGKKARARARR